MRPAGSEEPAPRVEIKNLNSIRAVTGALKYEVRRQRAALEEGKTVARETRLWDEQRERTARMRSKEEAQDYRYFPEPDLVPYEVTDEWLDKLKEELPELPLARRRRFRTEFGLSDYDAEVLTNQRAVADYYESAVRAHPDGTSAAKNVANWVMNDILRECNDRKVGVNDLGVPAQDLAELVKMTDDGKINANVASEILTKMIETGKDAATLVEEEGAEQISDTSELDPVIAQVIDENPQPVEDYLNGKKQAVGALVGQVMRITQGKADPKLANKMLREKLDGMQD
jgi:aspartyl-tRNA(Asn)/glutamyl-tRNA(Gln) amidotransferase subunit B